MAQPRSLKRLDGTYVLVEKIRMKVRHSLWETQIFAMALVSVLLFKTIPALFNTVIFFKKEL